VGKSALVGALTNAAPEVADFPHTTRVPTPGMMPFENIQIQLIDTPPVSREYTEPWLPDIIRRADMILVVVDVTTDPVQQLEDTVTFLADKRIAPMRLAHLYEGESGWSFSPMLVIANKNDDGGTEENVQIFQDLVEDNWPMVAVSATTGRNLKGLKEIVFDRLEVIRIYTKMRGKAPDRRAPFVLSKGATVEDLAARIHKDYLETFKFAKIWGQHVYDGQMVHRDHVLYDEDVVELHV
jgi:ribosome-interacting GTPase 1